MMKTISPDSHLYTDGVYVFTTERAQAAWATCYQELAEALADPQVTRVVLLVGVPGSGKSTWVSEQPDDPTTVLFDATFAKLDWRTPVVEQVLAAGKQVEAVWVMAPIEVVKERNALRSTDRVIPDEVIDSMFDLLNAEPPTRAEGFSEVFLVSGFGDAPG
jgi:predicted kinase